MGCWRTELSSCCFTGFWKLGVAHTCCVGCWILGCNVADLREHFPPHAIVSWMWCFNLSELRWHVSNKWFLGAAVHTGSNGTAALYLNDWFLDSRLLGYTSEGSCHPAKCMKLYYAAHFENVCTTFFLFTDKRGCKNLERGNKGDFTDRVSLLTMESCRSPHGKGSRSQALSLDPPFVLALLGQRQRLAQQPEPGRLAVSQTKWWLQWVLEVSSWMTSFSGFTGKQMDLLWCPDGGLIHVFLTITPAAQETQHLGLSRRRKRKQGLNLFSGSWCLKSFVLKSPE